MRPEDIQLLTVPGPVTLRGDLLLVATACPDLETNSYRGGLRRVALDGSADELWTRGHRDAEPVISPDGRWVAFLRADSPGARAQLHVMPTGGGEARRVTDLPLGARPAVWAPDSRRLAFTARVPEPGRYGTAEGVQPRSEAPRWITRLDYRWDDVGFTGDCRIRLFVVDALAEGAEPAELTDGRCDVGRPCWTPDGAHLVFAAHRDWGVRETQHRDLYAVPAGGGDPVLVVRAEGDADLPVVGDGVVVFYDNEFTDLDVVARNNGLWIAPLRFDGPVKALRLTDVETVDVEEACGPPVIVGGSALVGVRNRGAVELRRVPLDGEAVPLSGTTLVAGERGAVRSFAADGDRVVVVVSTPDTAGRVELHPGATVLADYSGPLRDSGLCRMRELTGASPDGYEPHGWVVLPDGPGPHPVVLAVHGGPFMYHGWSFFDEAQVYASAGYAVVLPNPRGSAGYGQAHGRAVVRAMATVDVDDVLSVLDAALALPECDADRVGIMGGSYGGFMTSWLAAHHGERFRAAWSERAVNAWDSFAGSSDIGWFFTDGYIGPDPETQRRLSPLYHADRISIPFAVVHSEEDWRCPLEQAQRMFVALRRAGAPAQMLVFPGEGHELTRSGQPRHRRERFDAVLSWWDRHLR